MSKNRFRSSKLLMLRSWFVTGIDLFLDTLLYLRPALKAFCVLCVMGVGVWGLLNAAKKSPYFKIKQVRVENTNRLSRQTVMDALQLDAAGNYFQFDQLAARARLLKHDWVADVSVEIHLPNRLTVRVQEREPVALVALDELYLVDAEGKVFAEASDVSSLPEPVITGLNKALLKSEPDVFKKRVRTALALDRLYRQSAVSTYRRLDSIHAAESGRWELMLGATHVILGEDRFDERLSYLAEVLKTIQERKVGAEYIMIAPELNRAIVKETILADKATELTLRTHSNRGETR